MSFAQINSSIVSPSSFFTGQFNGSINKELSQVIKKITSVTPSFNERIGRHVGLPKRLDALASSVVAKSIQHYVFSEPARVEKYWTHGDEISESAAIHIRDKIRTELCKITEPKDLAVHVAKEQIMDPYNTDSYKDICIMHNITDSEEIKEINNFAINNAKERMRRGGNCDDIQRVHHFDDRKEFELIAIKGMAGKRVLNGESCDVVAKDFGIMIMESRDILEMTALKGVAGKRVLNGDPCDVIARDHGITTRKARAALEAMIPTVTHSIIDGIIDGIDVAAKEACSIQ